MFHKATIFIKVTQKFDIYKVLLVVARWVGAYIVIN